MRQAEGQGGMGARGSCCIRKLVDNMEARGLAGVYGKRGKRVL